MSEELTCSPQQKNFTRLFVICIIVGILLNVLGWLLFIPLLMWLSSIAWLGAVIFFILSCWFYRIFKVDLLGSLKKSM